MKKLNLVELNSEKNYRVEWVRGVVGGKVKDLDVKIVGEEVCELFKSDGKWGKFGNMSSVGLNSLYVNGLEFISSENLYVCLKLESGSVEGLRMLSGRGCKIEYRRLKSLGLVNERNDFNDVMIDLMRYVLRVKLFYNEEVFGKLLRESEGKDIVEVCNRYDERSKIWGCGLFGSKKDRSNIKGKNYLGKLLMELRDEYKEKGYKYNEVKSNGILLCGEVIEDLKK
jgi:predicted NAD-dependent protein-ADP-ribosyltransferase YbiA (DUF1768 family)